MRIAVVGAGLSGLAAARSLNSHGYETVVFEKSAALGGRCATRRVGDYVFDSGATSIAPRGLSLAKVLLEELPTDDLVEIQLPIFVHSALRITAGDSHRGKARRFVYRQGINQLAKLLAGGLDVRLNATIESIERKGDQFAILNEQFDRLVLTPPIPQTTALLWQLDIKRPTANVSYRSCISVMLGFAHSVSTPYHAVIDVEQRHPLAWMSVESAKAPGRAPEGHCALVLQFSAAYSLEHYTQSDEALIATAVNFVHRLLGSDLGTPAASSVKRWKYSQPEGFSAMSGVNRPGDRIILAGDGYLGPRLEEAYESGLNAARLVTEP